MKESSHGTIADYIVHAYLFQGSFLGVYDLLFFCFNVHVVIVLLLIGCGDFLNFFISLYLTLTLCFWSFDSSCTSKKDLSFIKDKTKLPTQCNKSFLSLLYFMNNFSIEKWHIHFVIAKYDLLSCHNSVKLVLQSDAKMANEVIISYCVVLFADSPMYRTLDSMQKTWREFDDMKNVVITL